MGIRVREKEPGSGVWWVFVTWRGRRRAKRVGERQAAEAVATQLRERLVLDAAGVFAPPPPVVRAGPTFATVAERWMAWYPGLHAIRPSTLDNHDKFLRVHLLPAFGILPITAVTRRRVQELIAALRAPGGSAVTGKALADSTIRTSLPTLRLILDFAVEEQWIPANPMTAGPRLWRSAPQPETIDPFTGRELRAILQAMAGLERDVATMLRLWAQAGMRAGEVRALTWGDLDLGRGLANVQRTRTRGRVGPTKTGRTRLVSVLHPVCEDIAAWEPGATAESRGLLAALGQRTVATLDPAGPLFSLGGRPIDEDLLYRLWRRALTKAAVRYREPEQLRHTWASTLLSRNAPIVYVANQGGWKNPGVLLKSYATWMPQVAPGRGAASATPLQPGQVDGR